MNKYNGKKRAKDWLGCRFRTKREFKNGWATMPAGSTGVVSSAGSPKGLHIKFDSCGHCGIQVQMSYVSYHDIDEIY